MRTALLLLLLIAFYGAGAFSITDARKYFEASVHSSEAGKYFLDNTGKADLSPLLSGYRGAVMMVMARHYFNPLSKLSSYNEGRELLESAIAREPGNIELLFLRYCIQTSSPAFLGYRHSIEKDRSMLRRSAPALHDHDLRTRIIQFLQRNDTADEAAASSIR